MYRENKTKNNLQGKKKYISNVISSKVREKLQKDRRSEQK